MDSCFKGISKISNKKFSWNKEIVHNGKYLKVKMTLKLNGFFTFSKRFKRSKNELRRSFLKKLAKVKSLTSKTFIIVRKDKMFGKNTMRY